MNTLENLPKPDDKVIPNVVIQTVKDIKNIPPKVYDNIKKYCKGYHHIIFTDHQCIKFIEKFYNKRLGYIFRQLKQGPHRADLFRYCYLYKFGGVYLDIKTNLISNIHDLFTQNYLYTVIGCNNSCIYQGIIATPANQHIFLVLINHIIKVYKQCSSRLSNIL